MDDRRKEDSARKHAESRRMKDEEVQRRKDEKEKMKREKRLSGGGGGDRGGGGGDRGGAMARDRERHARDRMGRTSRVWAPDESCRLCQVLITCGAPLQGGGYVSLSNTHGSQKNVESLTREPQYMPLYPSPPLTSPPSLCPQPRAADQAQPGAVGCHAPPGRGRRRAALAPFALRRPAHAVLGCHHRAGAARQGARDGTYDLPTIASMLRTPRSPAKQMHPSGRSPLDPFLPSLSAAFPAFLHLTHPLTSFFRSQVNEFFAADFLPLCRQLMMTTTLPEQNEQLSNWPDPGRPLMEHSNAARTMAFAFIRRQQLLRNIR